MNYIDTVKQLTDQAIKSIIRNLEYDLIYGKFINEFYFTYSKLHKKSYLWYELQFKKLKIVEYK